MTTPCEWAWTPSRPLEWSRRDGALVRVLPTGAALGTAPSGFGLVSRISMVEMMNAVDDAEPCTVADDPAPRARKPRWRKWPAKEPKVLPDWWHQMMETAT